MKKTAQLANLPLPDAAGLKSLLYYQNKLTTALFLVFLLVVHETHSYGLFELVVIVFGVVEAVVDCLGQRVAAQLQRSQRQRTRVPHGFQRRKRIFPLEVLSLGFERCQNLRKIKD